MTKPVLKLQYPAFWQHRGWKSHLLSPLGWLYCTVAAKRRRQRGSRGQLLPVPVVVVGNITVGGTGKTPVVLALIKALRARGYCPGVVSRGFGAKIGQNPILVDEQTPVDRCGDEPLLIVQQTKAPVAVHPQRVAAGYALLSSNPAVDVIIADDGFQHHALARTVDWVVIDAQRKLGNQRCIPAGPLREHPRALNDADAVLINGHTNWAPKFGPKPTELAFKLTCAIDLSTRQHCDLNTLAGRLSGLRVLAIAGIGNPQSFFSMLTTHGIKATRTQALADHQPLTSQQIDCWLKEFDVILMTEKDAVKLTNLEGNAGRLYAIAGEVSLPADLIDNLLKCIAHGSITGKEHGQTST